MEENQAQTTEELQKQLDEETKLKEEYLNDLKRVQAEFQNYQKRIKQENIEFMKYAKQELILELLDILDNFEIAVKNKKNSEEFSKGVDMIIKQLKETLEKEGVKQIKEQYFNPEKHEVISTEEGEENKIIEEFQKGYMLNGRVIRASKVKVGKGGKNESKSD